MKKVLLQSVQDVGRRYLGITSIVNGASVSSGCSGSLSVAPYSSFLLRAVQFDPEKIMMNEEENCIITNRANVGEHICPYTSTSISFPWISACPCMNGFRSVHGGSLCTLAETFSKIHVLAAVMAAGKSMNRKDDNSPPSSTCRSTCLLPLHFDIRFLSATGENQKCFFRSRIRSGKEEEIISLDFSFMNEESNSVMAVGTQVFTYGK